MFEGAAHILADDADAEKLAAAEQESEEKNARLSTDAIQKAVAEYFELQVRDLTGSKRPKNIAEARMIAMYLARYLTDLPLKQIGQEFGGRNHTTVIHAVNQVKTECKDDPRLQHTIVQLKRDLNIVEE